MKQFTFQFDTLKAEVINGIIPRDYQQSAISNAFDLWERGVVGVLNRQPTGTGKTVVGTLTSRKWLDLGSDRRVLVLAHERQLVHQFAEEIEDILKIRPGIEMADEAVKANKIPKITVASRATLIAKPKTEGDEKPILRLEKFDPMRYQWLIILDEAHRWLWSMPSCKPILEHFAVNPNSRRLGLTATPQRSDKKTLGKIFQSVACDYRYHDLFGGPSAVTDGWAVPYDQRFITVEGVDFKDLKTVAADFDEHDLEEKLGDRKTLLSFVKPTVDLVGDRRTLCFSATVNLAKWVAHTLNEFKENSAVSIDGSTPEFKRKAVYAAHQKGEFQFLSVCGLCLAKGTLVLTDCGEVPIEQVTTEMKLWDGIEFVNHGGVISKGKKSVIQYAGLTATGDHNVWTDNGWERLAACKQRGIAIRVSAVGGEAVWDSDGYYRNDHSSWQEPAGWLGNSLRRLRNNLYQKLQPIENWSVGLQAMCKALWRAELAAYALSLCKEALRESERRVLSGLWWPWNRVPLCIADGNGPVDHGEHRTAQGIDPGPQRQQQALRAGQHSLGQSDRASEQQEAASPGLPQEIAEVFDIVNAGPRHRFTANGLIVSNCREGYNDPGIGAVAIYRPTKSKSLKEQMLGRGCRPLRGIVNSKMTKEERLAAIAASDKSDCMVIDLVGCTGMGESVSAAHVLANGLPDEVVDLANKNALEKTGSVDMADELRKAKVQIDEEQESIRKKKARMEAEANERQEAARMARLQADVRYSQHKVNGSHGSRMVRVEGPKNELHMLFGKHKGKPISTVPTGYLEWKVSGAVKLKQWYKDAIASEILRRRNADKPRTPNAATRFTPPDFDAINAELLHTR